jgi:hypothetical protein
MTKKELQELKDIRADRRKTLNRPAHIAVYPADPVALRVKAKAPGVVVLDRMMRLWVANSVVRGDWSMANETGKVDEIEIALLTAQDDIEAIQFGKAGITAKVTLADLPTDATIPALVAMVNSLKAKINAMNTIV